MNTESCDCRRLTGECRLEKPGDFYFENSGKPDRLYLYILLPGEVRNNIPIEVRRGDAGDKYCWGWDGDMDKPTLTPSINCIGVWHGWLRKGRLESC